MKERPILFSAPMVRAVLAGQKTQTRRVVKAWEPSAAPNDKPVPADLAYLPDFTCYRATCPHGAPGDRLWMREAWRAPLAYELTPPRDIPAGTPVVYEADGTGSLPHFNAGKLRPSMFMPRWASRTTFVITGVRVGRLGDINDADAEAEGISTVQVSETQRRWTDYTGNTRSLGDPKRSFWTLWETINGRDSLAANPWVWVIEFRRLP